MPTLTSQTINDPASEGSSRTEGFPNPLLDTDASSSATYGMRQGMQNDLQNRDNPLARMAEEKRAGVNDPFNSSNLTQSNSYTGDVEQIDKNLQGLTALGDLYTGKYPSGVDFSQHEYVGDHDGRDWAEGIGQLIAGSAMLTGTQVKKNKILAKASDTTYPHDKNVIGDVFERTSPSKASRAENYAKLDRYLLDAAENRATYKRFAPASKIANKVQTARLDTIERIAGEAVPAEKASAKLGAKTAEKAAAKTATQSGEKVIARYATKEGVKVVTKEAGRGIAKGAALRVLPRLGLAAAFPVGTAVSVALIALDPGLVNFIRKGIIEGLFSNSRTPDMDTPPEPPRTYFLPLCHDGNRDPAIEETDTQLVSVNNSTFTFDPDKVWPVTPEIETTGTFDSYLELFNKMNDLVLEAVQGSYGPLQEFQDEQQVNRLLEARAPFIEAMTALPVDLLQEVANESLYPISGFSNAYAKFREIINMSRLTIHESGNVDTWLFGLLANPKDLIDPRNTLDAEEMLNVANEMEAVANEIDQGNTRLAGIKFDWRFTEKSMQPVFNLSSLQENYSQGIENHAQHEEAERVNGERNIQPINHATPSPSYPNPRVMNPRLPNPGDYERPGRNIGGRSTDSVRTPRIPDIDTSTTGITETPDITPPKTPNLANTLPKIDTTTTETSKFSPDNLPKPDTTTTPKTPKLNADSAKTEVSKAEPTLPNPSGASPTGLKTPTVEKPTTKLSQSPNLPTVDQTPKTSTGITTPPTPKTDPKNPQSPLNTQNLTNGVRGNNTTTLPAAHRTPNVSSGIKTPPAPTPSTGGGIRGGGIPTNPINPASAPSPAKPDNPVQAGINNHGEKPAPAPADPAPEAPEAPEFEDNPTPGERETTTVSRDGKTFDMGSGKAAKLAELINPTDGSAPISLREAMGEAGYDVPDPGANPGKPISPMDLQPGDLVVGEKHQGVYIGDGMVLTSDGLKPLNEVAVFSGNDPNQGLFRPDAAEVDAESSRTGQDASATQDFEAGDETKSSGKADGGESPRVGPGLGGLGHNGARAAVGNANAGRKASVTPGGDPFDPSGSKVASDPFERIAVTGTGGIGRSFGPNVPTGD